MTTENPTLAEGLEELYGRLNRRCFVHPDPLEFLYRYDDPDDREVVGLIASSLAFGRVAQILKSIETVLALMPRPAEFIREATARSLRAALAGFRHRFSTGEDVAHMLLGARRLIERHGSIGCFFAEAFEERHENILPALERFVCELYGRSDCRNYLTPSPALGSACKRLNLYLRWMVRSDEVDPGGWHSISPAKLIIPLDTHMHRIARALGMTRRKQADARTAVEITEAFRRIEPDDPVKYDFALTRLGIRGDCAAGPLIEKCLCREVA